MANRFGPNTSALGVGTARKLRPLTQNQGAVYNIDANRMGRAGLQGAIVPPVSGRSL